MNGRGLLFPKISWLTLLISGLCLTSGGLAADEIRFSRHVLPLLADRCFHCHGPDENNRQADLRLDERTAAIDSGVIIPHDAASSELMVRILSEDPDLQMPPADSHRKAFSPTEVNTAAPLDRSARHGVNIGRWKSLFARPFPKHLGPLATPSMRSYKSNCKRTNCNRRPKPTSER
ncbi:MAG: c-type cytochrome domain-containing protein [Pirellulaceae bacterium]